MDNKDCSFEGFRTDVSTLIITFASYRSRNFCLIFELRTLFYLREFQVVKKKAKKKYKRKRNKKSLRAVFPITSLVSKTAKLDSLSPSNLICLRR